LTLKHLRYLDALARLGHFGKAAAACSITQPALSMQIKELETMLGAPLVERAARSIRLTPLGEEFVRRARTILQSVEELGELARASDGPLVGRLRLGIIPTMAPYLLPRMIRLLADQYPSLDLRPREAVTEQVVEDLLDARLDAAIVALPISEPALHEFALFDEEFLLMRPESDADKPVPNPTGLMDMPLLLLEEGHCFRDQALSFCNASELAPGSVMEGNSLSTLVQMVSAGIGATLIPEMALDLEMRAAGVSAARFPEPRPHRTVGMVWRKTNPLSQQLTQMGGAIRTLGNAT
ncbi:MAG: LysR substrate-binding domain-containing protein, partial [Pseudomonadota bacterium]